MGEGLKAILSIFTAIIGVAILAVLVSKKSNTEGLISSVSSGFSSVLKAALGPVS